MANIFTRLVETYRPVDYIEKLREARLENEATSFENTRLRETVVDLNLYLEDLNWTKLGDGWEQDDSGLSLRAIKENADVLQSLLTINPSIKKAINARVGYIWGRGVQIKTSNKSLEDRIINTARNKAKLFSDHAYWELEATLGTDGNLWTQRNKQTNEVVIIPLEHIGGWICDEDDPSRVNYWLVQYQRAIKNFTTGETDQEEVKYFVPAHDAEPRPTRTIEGIPVRRDLEMIHLAANRQRGWILGVPDIMAAMFWAKAHKELYEAGTTFVKAQGKFAAKVVSKNELGGQGAAATLRDTERRDPMTGESLYGGTAIATGGLDYQLMGAMTKGVDFASFDGVGALVAAGLGIPLRVLMADSGDDITSLEQSVVNEMQMRQKLWSWFYTALFGGKADIFWPKIRTEPEYRRIQSVEIANQTNVLKRPELRQLTLEGFGLDGDPNDLPGIKEQPDVAISAATLIQQQKADEAAAKSGAIDAKGQGVATGIGRLADGTDAKASRNNPLDGNTKGQ
jgi:hypothetical protein